MDPKGIVVGGKVPYAPMPGRLGGYPKDCQTTDVCCATPYLPGQAQTIAETRGAYLRTRRHDSWLP